MRRFFPLVEADSEKGEKVLDRLLRRAEKVLDKKVRKGARRLVRGVQEKGDPFLLEAVNRLDGAGFAEVGELRLPLPDLAAEKERLPEGFAEALERAIEAVEVFHRRQVTPGYTLEKGGVTLSERREALRRVGVYVPGGRASYPSTVLMTVIPARLAGVEEIAVATPPGGFSRQAPLRYTLARLGVDEVWGMGGAQAVAAFAYGTATVPRVDKIVGPGNAWVTAAKREVMGDVGIDGLAGPTEVLVVAEEGAAEPAAVAADLLAQAEHDPRAAAVLLTPSRSLAREVRRELRRQLEGLATAELARESLKSFGVALLVDRVEDALAWIERFAPEHLQLIGPEAEALAPQVRSAGAIFLGAATPEVFGDYVAGPSHVLPTGGSARFASALGVEDFVRRSHTVRFTPQAAGAWAETAGRLADAEGLPAHAASARRRR
jgi:histidinol dehydrogenase